jgi:hypothetical protein
MTSQSYYDIRYSIVDKKLAIPSRVRDSGSALEWPIVLLEPDPHPFILFEGYTFGEKRHNFSFYKWIIPNDFDTKSVNIKFYEDKKEIEIIQNDNNIIISLNDFSNNYHGIPLMESTLLYTTEEEKEEETDEENENDSFISNPNYKGISPLEHFKKIIKKHPKKFSFIHLLIFFILVFGFVYPTMLFLKKNSLTKSLILLDCNQSNTNFDSMNTGMEIFTCRFSCNKNNNDGIIFFVDNILEIELKNRFWVYCSRFNDLKKDEHVDFSNLCDASHELAAPIVLFFSFASVGMFAWISVTLLAVTILFFKKKKKFKYFLENTVNSNNITK